jgi:tRNA G18 (ribose-2'-O)-methylase SpoU
VEKIILSGYTPYPVIENDARLPHIAEKLTSQIHKTALGAEAMLPFEYSEALDLAKLKQEGYEIIALEQHARSLPLVDYEPARNVALLLGEEVEGIAPELLEQCATILEIPMKGQKESFNVSVAAGIALYALSIE